MKEVKVSIETSVPRDRLLAELSPEAIIEYADTFEIESTTDGHPGKILTVTGGDIEMTLQFERTDDGYTYEQLNDDGPFEEMRSSVSVVREPNRTRVVAKSRFTFGGWFPFLTDRWAAKYRQEELERLVANLMEDVEQQASEGNPARIETRDGDPDLPSVEGESESRE